MDKIKATFKRRESDLIEELMTRQEREEFYKRIFWQMCIEEFGAQSIARGYHRKAGRYLATNRRTR